MAEPPAAASSVQVAAFYRFSAMADLKALREELLQLAGRQLGQLGGDFACYCRRGRI